jgi:hypothetical protein
MPPPPAALPARARPPKYTPEKTRASHIPKRLLDESKYTHYSLQGSPSEGLDATSAFQFLRELRERKQAQEADAEGQAAEPITFRLSGERKRKCPPPTEPPQQPDAHTHGLSFDLIHDDEGEVAAAGSHQPAAPQRPATFRTSMTASKSAKHKQNARQRPTAAATEDDT